MRLFNLNLYNAYKTIRVIHASVCRTIKCKRQKRYMFGDTTRPFKSNMVNLIYWKEGMLDNVGDLLSKVIVEFIVRKAGIDPYKQIKAQKQFAAIGSIIDAITLPCTVWGSGLRTTTSRPQCVSLDIRAIRGPKTASILDATGYNPCSVFGDPGLLMPLFYEPKARSKKEDILFIPHFRHIDKYNCAAKVINTLDCNWKTFIDEIYNSRVVASSSLHGLVLAEAYGIPTILLSDLDADGFKYSDYYEGTDREFTLNPVKQDQVYNSEPISGILNLEDIQKRLLNAFPFDLWD